MPFSFGEIFKNPFSQKGFLKLLSFGIFPLQKQRKVHPNTINFIKTIPLYFTPQLIFILKTPRAPKNGARGVFYSGRVDIWGLYAGEVMVTSGA